jgi:hypothetical protein
MKIHIAAIAATLALGVPAAGLAAVDVSGIYLDTGPLFMNGSLFENSIANVGDELTGYGRIDSINGLASSSFCVTAGCELTYQFGGFKVVNATNVSGAGFTVDFSGGWVKMYLGTGMTTDFNPYTSGSQATDITAATNGTLWLSSQGHGFQDQFSGRTGTLLGNGYQASPTSIFGSGHALLDMATVDAATGAANAYFDHNAVADGLGGYADMDISANFSSLSIPPHGQTALAGSVSLAAPVPEPESFAMMLVGLAVVGVAAKRRSRKA